MASSVKVTFTLDAETVARLRQTAERLKKPQSQVVREAVAEYAAAADRLSDAERRHLLDTFDRLVPQVPERPVRDVQAELGAVRQARRGGGRKTTSPRR